MIKDTRPPGPYRCYGCGKPYMLTVVPPHAKATRSIRWVGDWHVAVMDDGFVIPECPECAETHAPGWLDGTYKTDWFDQAENQLPFDWSQESA
jgi:hypothetical protein